MYTRDDILTRNDLSLIEDRILKINSTLINMYPNLQYFKKTNWSQRTFPYIQDIDKLERAIDSIKKNYKPDLASYIPARIWLENGINYGQGAISYEDVNRWLYNLELLERNLKMEKYVGTFFCGERFRL